MLASMWSPSAVRPQHYIIKVRFRCAATLAFELGALGRARRLLAVDVAFGGTHTARLLFAAALCQFAALCTTGTCPRAACPAEPRASFFVVYFSVFRFWHPRSCCCLFWGHLEKNRNKGLENRQTQAIIVTTAVRGRRLRDVSLLDAVGARSSWQRCAGPLLVTRLIKH